MTPESERYWSLVHSLIDRGIVSRERWQLIDPAQYNYYNRHRSRGFKIRHILRDVVRHMCWSRTLSDYITDGSDVTEDEMLHNPVYELLRVNGYDPVFVGSLILLWASHASSRNTLWIRGLPETGAPYLAEAIVYCSPLLGSVDWRNKSNPFEGCPSCLVYWWDGGYIYDCCVGLVKQVLRGEHVILPSDGLRGVPSCPELFRTPVLIYSQKDMCVTRLRSGELSLEHSSGLRDCMYVIHLLQGLEISCAISCADVRRFLGWCQTCPVPVYDTHELK